MTRIAELASSLAALADQLAPGGGAIEGLTRLSGGASLETWSFDIAGQGFVLRREPIGYGRAATKAGLSVEAELMRLAAAAGAPSPRVRLTLRPEHGLGEGFIMDRVEGETIAKRVVNYARMFSDPDCEPMVTCTTPGEGQEILASGGNNLSDGV